MKSAVIGASLMQTLGCHRLYEFSNVPIGYFPSAWRSEAEGVFSGDPSAGSEATEDRVEHPRARSEHGGSLAGEGVLLIPLEGFSISRKRERQLGNLPEPPHLSAEALQQYDGSCLTGRGKESVLVGNPQCKDNSDFVLWYRKVSRRPVHYKGERRQGYFTVDNFHASTPIETNQFNEGLIPGNTLTMWLNVKGDKTKYGEIGRGRYCFAGNKVADFLEQVGEGEWLYGEIKCLGQIKVYETTMPDPDDPERGTEYYPAWLITEVRCA